RPTVTPEQFVEHAERLRDRLKEAQAAEEAALAEARTLADLLEEEGYPAFPRYDAAMNKMVEFLIDCLDPEINVENVSHRNLLEIQDVLDPMRFAMKGRGDA